MRRRGAASRSDLHAHNQNEYRNVFTNCVSQGDAEFERNEMSQAHKTYSHCIYELSKNVFTEYYFYSRHQNIFVRICSAMRKLSAFMLRTVGASNEATSEQIDDDDRKMLSILYAHRGRCVEAMGKLAHAHADYTMAVEFESSNNAARADLNRTECILGEHCKRTTTLSDFLFTDVNEFTKDISTMFSELREAMLSMNSVTAYEVAWRFQRMLYLARNLLNALFVQVFWAQWATQYLRGEAVTNFNEFTNQYLKYQKYKGLSVTQRVTGTDEFEFQVSLSSKDEDAHNALRIELQSYCETWDRLSEAERLANTAHFCTKLVRVLQSSDTLLHIKSLYPKEVVEVLDVEFHECLVVPLEFLPYTFEEKLGHGACGVVYKALSPARCTITTGNANETRYAVKLLRLNMCDQSAPDTLYEVLKELRTNIRLPYCTHLVHLERIRVVPLVCVNATGQLSYVYSVGLQMEQLSMNLAAWCKRRNELLNVEGRTSLNDSEFLIAVKLLADITRGLSCLHEHDIVHGDLKPDNVLIRSRDPLPPIALLVDFNICSIKSAGAATVQSTSTQQDFQQGDGLGDSASKDDVYFLGRIMAYLFLAGTENDAFELCEDISDGKIESADVLTKFYPDFSEGNRRRVCETMYEVVSRKSKDLDRIFQCSEIFLTDDSSGLSMPAKCQHSVLPKCPLYEDMLCEWRQLYLQVEASKEHITRRLISLQQRFVRAPKQTFDDSATNSQVTAIVNFHTWDATFDAFLKYLHDCIVQAIQAHDCYIEKSYLSQLSPELVAIALKDCTYNNELSRYYVVCTSMMSIISSHDAEFTHFVIIMPLLMSHG